jgi:hypothetical protein
MPNTVDPEPLPEPRGRADQAGQAAIYEIRLAGHLDHAWSDWFEGLTIALDADGTTLLSGLVADQAALHGVLRKIRDLGMPLLSVEQIASRPTL